jgi:ribosomal protein L19
MVFNSLEKQLIKRKFIQFRNSLRRKIKGLNNCTFFLVGDIIKVSFLKSIHPLVFEGMCISLKNRGFMRSGVSFILRNIILGVGIEVRILYYLNRQFSLIYSNHKRKFDLLKKNKLLEVRFSKNRKSKVWL